MHRRTRKLRNLQQSEAERFSTRYGVDWYVVTQFLTRELEGLTYGEAFQFLLYDFEMYPYNRATRKALVDGLKYQFKGEG